MKHDFEQHILRLAFSCEELALIRNALQAYSHNAQYTALLERLDYMASARKPLKPIRPA